MLSVDHRAHKGSGFVCRRLKFFLDFCHIAIIHDTSEVSAQLSIRIDVDGKVISFLDNVLLTLHCSLSCVLTGVGHDKGNRSSSVLLRCEHFVLAGLIGICSGEIDRIITVRVSETVGPALLKAGLFFTSYSWNEIPEIILDIHFRTRCLSCSYTCFESKTSFNVV